MEENYDLKPVRRIFSRIGMAFCAILILGTVLQLGFILIPAAIWGEDNWLATSSWGLWISTFLPLLLVVYFKRP